MVKKIRKKGARRVRPGRGRQTPGRGGGLPAHGQKTRWLKGLSGGWQVAWRAVVDPGTPINEDERLAERYTWRRDKYELHYNEVAGVGAGVLTLDFKPVPKKAGGGGHDLGITCHGYYSGNHSAGHAPKFQIYDYVGTDWEDISGMVFSTGGSEYETLEGRVPFDAKYFETGTDNVRLRILHPVVGGNPAHEFHINQVAMAVYGTTTTSTTSTTTTV